MKNRLLIAGLLACLGTATTFAADAAGVLDGAAAQAFRTAHPGARFYLTGDRITTVYGEAFGEGMGAVDTAERFLAANSRMLGVENGDLLPGSLAGDDYHVHSFYPTEDGGSKFTLVSYLQYRDGIQVFRGNVRLLTRNEAGSPLVLVRSGLRPIGDFVPDQAVAAAPNVGAAFEDAMLRFPGMTNFDAPQVMIWAGTGDEAVAPRLAIVFTGEGGNQADSGTYLKHLIVSDAATGRMLWSENQVHNVDITGSVKANVTNSYRAGVCDPETLIAMPYARVTVGATSYYADVNGNFTIPNGGTTAVTVGSMVRGRWFQVLNAAGAESTLSQNVTPPGPANFVHNPANNTELQLAEVNAYQHANVVRDHLLLHSPGFPTIVNQQNWPVNVMVAGTCNAFYNGSSINFYPAGGGCNNTAFGTVVHHEYGHHIVNRAGSGQGAYGEGYGDLMGIIITDDPRLGLGFSGCNSAMRTGANNYQYPCSGEIHDCGQLLTGCFWSTRNELLATNPSTYRTIISTLACNSVLLHDGEAITPQITIDCLTLDDNNANLNDGTPHYQEIAAGFGAHNMDAPPLVIMNYTYPGGRAANVNPDGGTAFQVQITGANGNVVNAASATLRVDPENDGTFATVSLQHLGSGLFNVNFPATTCGTNIPYYLSASTTTGATVRDPEGAPATSYTAVSAVSIATAYSENFESGAGWTTAYSGGVAVGTWQRGVPGGFADASPPTDFDASGQCYVTGNNSAGQDINTNGVATLTSPVFDGTTGDQTLSYARWYSNSSGANSHQDVFVVDISNDNGATWVNLETVGPIVDADGGWKLKSFRLADTIALTSQMKVRFVAADASPGSEIEAAVDAFSVRVIDCGSDCAADFDGDGFVSGTDFDLYVAAFEAGDLAADFDGDGFITGSDYDLYVIAYEAGC